MLTLFISPCEAEAEEEEEEEEEDCFGGCFVIQRKMGSCVSTSNGERTSAACLKVGFLRWKRSRRRKTFSDAATLQNLGSIRNRIFSNGRSTTSCIFTQQGRKGINQDAMIVWEDFVAEDMIFCGVFDGHGPHGHLVARKVRDTLPLKLSSFLNPGESKKKKSAICGNCCNASDTPDVEETANADFIPEEGLDSLYEEAFLKSFKAMDKELRSHPNLDCFCSGSTAVTIIKQGSNLFIGNIGDSRAILGSKDGDDDAMVAVQLTVDLKPDLPKEAERIKRCKGRVFALQDEPEVQRVWLPFDDAPGLAMARAFGDFCLKDYGVISIPEFSHRILSDRDKFIVLASDGVWDVLSNEEVVGIVSTAPSRSAAARMLVEVAAREWKTKFPTSKMDDCAVVCLFLDGKMDSSESDHEDQQQHQGGRDSGNAAEAAGDAGEDSSEPRLQRNFTVRTAAAGNDGGSENATGDDQNWSGLEGVTR
ncbi:hypothetical protein M569_04548, partial [Genlisea aurea]